MAKGSGGKGLAVFALIIGLGGLGLSAYTYLMVIPGISSESSINQVWYDSRVSPYSLSTSFYDIPDLELVITVNQGENVYILFNGEFTLSSGTNGGEVRLRIDEVTQTGSHKGFFGDSSSSHWGTVTMQFVSQGLSVGTHTIKIQATAAGGTGTIQNMNLFVYTYT